MTAYNTRTAEYRSDLRELVGLSRAEGYDASDRRCREIIAARGLNGSEALTLSANVLRHVALGFEV